ncbi:Mitochondrial substrate carrier family protein [Abeliophyllum distichum]|uniref:Mitochondrial substrate carrier family protein n=1 Tax=Abeliophyllum distichum TaxID=126358 RepID=A0ABD1R1D5_9LAMI
MAGSSRLKKNYKPSIKYRHNPLEGAFFELSDFYHVDNPITRSENDKCTPRNSETQSSEILSTAELISAASYIWDRASQPLSILLPKTSSRCKTDVCQEGDETRCSSDEVTFCTSTSTDDQYFSVNLTSKTDSAPVVSTNLECLSVTQKISCFQPNSESCSLLSILHGRSTTTHESCKEKQLPGIGIAHNLCSIYGRMSEIAIAKPPDQVNSMRIKYRGTSDCYVGSSSSSPTSGCMSTNTTGSNSLVVGNSDCNAEAVQPVGSLLSENAHFDLSASTCSSYLEIATSPHEVEANNFKIHASRFDADFQVTLLESGSHACEESEKETEECRHEHQNNQEIKSIKGESSDVEVCLSAKEKPHYALAKQEHAFAGAMAGIFVSLSLHPVDTVKTVFQSCRMDQKPLHDICRSIISERGVMGLYRGISSNIASSAPISAVYTFTYESVKSTLVPFFPKEYQSLAHCMAGGCASIATSFIFTPSERIKQQLQVGSHYRNCWNALIEIIQKGGLSSLYTGWGAVLCRNIPHSVIKFYTYERLKQLMLPSDQPNALATLVCGGLAGSTAAFFTTPFDVVKTRYQTQIPGSVNQYDGIFNTLKDIAKREGLKGLYRGLTPRLAMYMIQGALFFASYESFKRLLSLEVPQLSSKPIQHEQSVEDDSVALHSPISVMA